MRRIIIRYIPTFVLLFGISLLAIGIRGYQFGSGDQVIHLPLLAKLRDPELFSKDSLFPLTLSHYTIIYSIHLFTRGFLQVSFFDSFLILYVISNALIFFGTYLLTLSITSNKKAAFFSVLFLVVPLPIGGSAIATIERILVPRFISTGLTLFAFVLFFQKKYIFSFLLVSISFLIHPLSGLLGFLLLSGSFFLLGLRKNFPNLMKGTILFAIMTAWSWQNFFRNAPSALSPFLLSEKWLEILKLRNPYAFPILWSARSWLYLAVLLLPVLAYLVLRKYFFKSFSNKDRVVLSFFLVSGLVFLVQIIFTSVFPVSAIIQLQLGRIWLFLVFFSFSYVSLFIAWLIKKIRLSIWLTKLVIVIGLLVVTYQKGGEFIKRPDPDWVDVQIWAKNHTSKECTFLVDFYSQGFRVYSERSTVGEYKDGTLSFYSEDFANIWYDKLSYFNREKHGGYIDSIPAINRKYPFTFVVLRNDIPISLENIYQNDIYSIYRVPTVESGCQVL